MPLFHKQILKEQIRDAARYWLIIPAMVTGSGLALDRYFTLPGLPENIGLALSGLAFLVAGIWLILKATSDLKHHGQGTPNPHRPAKLLVTSSSYRWCRHPLFFGYDLAALGTILLCRSWAMLLFSFPIMLVWQYRFLRKEEYLLSRRFRKDYAAYRSQVRMLLPWPRLGGAGNKKREPYP